MRYNYYFLSNSTANVLIIPLTTDCDDEALRDEVALELLDEAVLLPEDWYLDDVEEQDL